MDRLVQLYWDFRGPKSAVEAERFLERLDAYPLNDINGNAEGYRMGAQHWAVTLTVPEPAVQTVRDTLGPHRGEYL